MRLDGIVADEDEELLLLLLAKDMMLHYYYDMVAAGVLHHRSSNQNRIGSRQGRILKPQGSQYLPYGESSEESANH